MESFITAALPGIDETTIEKLNSRLEEIGVLNIEDLKFVEEEYIKDILKPIQAKKFLHHCKSLEVIPAETAEIPTVFVEQPVICQETSKICHKVVDNWAECFTIPFEAFPKEIEEASDNNIRPLKVHINEMVRSIVTKITNVTETPGRKNLRIIAGKVIQRYPGIFQDRWGDSVVGDGMTTLMKRLENCLDNRKRTRSTIEDCFANGGKRRKTLRKSYGCVQWQPLDIPDGETTEKLLEYQECLKQEFLKEEKDTEKIHHMMNSCYGVQRYHINNISSCASSIQKEWPFLLEENYILSHCAVLLNKDVKQIFLDEMPLKAKKIYDFMKTKTKFPKVANAIRKIEQAKNEVGNLTPEFIGAFPLLMAFFNEEESLLFKEKIGPDDIKAETLLTPYLVTFGCNLFNAEEYALVIDGQITTHMKGFPTALAVLFSTYFMLNIEYNADTALTLEFIQRCIMEINPSRGTKVSKKERVKHSSITQKVTKLATEINEFERVFKVKL